jgi:hypothetical protein
MQNLKKITPKHPKQTYRDEEDVSIINKQAINFITAGVGCNCLVALQKSNILEKLLKKGLSIYDVEKQENPLCIKAALVTLEQCNIVCKHDRHYEFTEFGAALAKYLGLITIFFDGYADLISKQGRIVRNKIQHPESLMRGPSISEASILISDQAVDPILLREFDRLKFSGTICDLGCGYGTKLSKICKLTNNDGLGFDCERHVIEEARKSVDKHVSLEVGDITNLEGIWEDVVILMQSFLFHDFNPEDTCIKIMNSYLSNFPNLRYFFYIDIMSPSAAKNKIFPGFDYIHGLLGIPTRTYEETLHMFHRSNYSIEKEIPISDLPNTFLWILTPRKK